MSSELPDYFKCPISLEIMSDPVILPSGHTFDRVSIQRWLDSGHRTCPITKLPLPEPTPLIPNHALRSLISNYTPTLLSPPDTAAAVSALASPRSSPEAKLDALTQLLAFTKSDPRARSRLAEAGAVSAVLRCLDEGIATERSLSLLLEMSLDDDNKVGIVAEGAVGRLVAAMDPEGATDAAAAATAATVVTSLAVVEVNKLTIGVYPGAIRALVGLLREGKGRGRKEAATALFSLCSFPGNCRRAVECGAVPVLGRMARSGHERAVEVVGLLSKCKEGREEMVKCEGLVEILIGFVRDGTSRGLQYGLMALNMLCWANHSVKEEVMNEGVLDICLGLIEDDNDKIRKIAFNLAQALQQT